MDIKKKTPKIKVECLLDISSPPIEIGRYKTKEEASVSAYYWFKERGYKADIDTKEEVVSSLMTRGFFLSAYAPRELVLSEV